MVERARNGVGRVPRTRPHFVQCPGKVRRAFRLPTIQRSGCVGLAKAKMGSPMRRWCVSGGGKVVENRRKPATHCDLGMSLSFSVRCGLWGPPVGHYDEVKSRGGASPNLASTQPFYFVHRHLACICGFVFPAVFFPDFGFRSPPQAWHCCNDVKFRQS